MNEQEAIEVLKRNKPTSDPRRCGKELCEACDIAIKALKRNRSKKVTDIQGDKLRFGTCPCCERRISTVERGNYCQNCGQRLEW